MSSCASIDLLVTPYVDDEIAPAERDLVEQHVGACAPCRNRVAAERVTRGLVIDRRTALRCTAPAALHTRCAAAAEPDAAVAPGRRSEAARPAVAPARTTWRPQFAPLAAAATVVFVLGGAALYEATGRSTRVMAAELAADHIKCFAVNAALGTHHSDQMVRDRLATYFDWETAVPRADGELDLVGSRPCLYGQGRIAHIMYRHNGTPVSLFMLPRTSRAPQTLEALGHACAIWSKDQRTFVLVSREARNEVQKLAAAVQASMP